MQNEVSVGSYDYGEAVTEDEVSEVGEGEDEVDNIYDEESFEDVGNVKSRASAEPAGDGYGDDFDEEELEEEQSAEPLPAAIAVPSAKAKTQTTSKGAMATNTGARAASSVDVDDDNYSDEDLVVDKENNTPPRAMASEDDGYGEDFDAEDDNDDHRDDVHKSVEPLHKQALSAHKVDESRASAGVAPLPAAVPLQQQQQPSAAATAPKAPKNSKPKAPKTKTSKQESMSDEASALPNPAHAPADRETGSGSATAAAEASSSNDNGSSATQVDSSKPRSILKKSVKVETAVAPAFDYLGPAAEDYWSGNAAVAAAAQPEVEVLDNADAGNNIVAGANDSPRGGGSVHSSKSGNGASSARRPGLGKGFVPPPLAGLAKGSAGQMRPHSASKDRSALKAAANGVFPGASGQSRSSGSRNSAKRPLSAPGLQPSNSSSSGLLPVGGVEQARQDVLNSMLAKRVADLEWQVAQQAAELVAQSPPGRPAVHSGGGNNNGGKGAGRATPLPPGSLTAAAPYYGGQHVVQEAMKVAVKELNSDPSHAGRTAKYTRKKQQPWRVNGSNPQAAAAGGGATSGASSDILFGAASSSPRKSPWPASRSPKSFLQAPSSNSSDLDRAMQQAEGRFSAAWEGSGPWAEDAAARTAQWKASQGKKHTTRGARDRGEDDDDGENDNLGNGDKGPASSEGVAGDHSKKGTKKKKKKKKKKPPAPGWERFLEAEKFTETAAVRTTSPIRSSGKRTSDEPSSGGGNDNGEDAKDGHHDHEHNNNEEDSAPVDAPVGVAGVKEMRRSMPSPYVYDTHGHKVLREVWEARRAEEANKKRAAKEAQQQQRGSGSSSDDKHGGLRQQGHTPRPPTACGELTGHLKVAYDEFVVAKKAQVEAVKEAAATLKTSRMAWLGAAYEAALHNNNCNLGSPSRRQQSDSSSPAAVQWPLYACLEGEGDVVVTVEARTSWTTAKSVYSRHDPAAYARCATTLRTAVAQKLANFGLRFAVEVCGGWQDPNAEHHVKGKFHHTNSIRAKPFQDDKAKDGRPEPRHGAFEVQVAFMTPEGAKGPNGQDCGDRLLVETVFSKLNAKCWPNIDRVVDKIFGILKTFSVISAADGSGGGDFSLELGPPTMQNGTKPKAVHWLLDDRPPPPKKSREVKTSPLGLPPSGQNSYENNDNTNSTTSHGGREEASPPPTSGTLLAAEKGDENEDEDRHPCPMEVTLWLQSLGAELVPYGTRLASAGFNSIAALATLGDPDQAHFEELGILPQHWAILMAASRRLRSDLKLSSPLMKAATSTSASPAPLPSSSSPEKRAAGAAPAGGNTSSPKPRKASLKKAEEVPPLTLQPSQQAPSPPQQPPQDLLSNEALGADPSSATAPAKLARTTSQEEDLTTSDASTRQVVEQAAAVLRELEEDGEGTEKETNLASNRERVMPPSATADAEAADSTETGEADKRQAERDEAAAAVRAKEAAAAAAEEEAKKAAAKQAIDLEVAALWEREEEKAQQAAAAAQRADANKMAAEAAEALKDEEEAKIQAQAREEAAAALRRQEEAAERQSALKAQEAENEAAAAAVARRLKALQEKEETAKQQQKKAAEEEELTRKKTAEASAAEEAKAKAKAAKKAAKKKAEEEAAAAEAALAARIPASWLYVDNHGNQQGPFSTTQMAQWCAFFKPDTRICPLYSSDDPPGAFTPLVDLYPDLSNGFKGPPKLPPNSNTKSGDKGSERNDDDDAYEDDAYEEDENDNYDDDYEEDADNNGKVETAAAAAAVAANQNQNQEEGGDDDDGYGDDFEDVGEGVLAAPVPAAQSEEALDENAYEDNFEAEEENYEDDDDVAYESPTDQVEIEEEERVVAPIATKSSSGDGSAKDVYRVGDVVEGRFGRGDVWYAGQVTLVHASSDQVDISYDDGDFESGVKAKYVRKVSNGSNGKEEKKKQNQRGGGKSGRDASPSAFEEEEVEEVVDDKGAVVKEEEEESRHSRRSSNEHKSKKSHRAAPTDQSVGKAKATVPEAAAAAAPPAMNSEEAYDSALECLSQVHGAMCALGQSPEQVFGALESASAGESSKKTSTNRHRPGFLTLEDFRQGCQVLFSNRQGLDMRPILGLTAGSTAWVGGSEADPAGEALMACLDRTGSGALTLRDLERFLRLPSGSVGALGVLWKRLREGVEASAKHNCETIDLQLFAKYDSLRMGACSLEELKRGLKHLKTLVPPFNQQDLSVLADAFPSEANPGQVNYLALVSWLNPVSLHRVARRASKQCRGALQQAQLPSPSKCTPADLCHCLGLDFPFTQPLNVQSFLELLSQGGNSSGSGISSEWSLAEARALLLMCSAQPERLELDEEGLLRVARMEAFTTALSFDGNGDHGRSGGDDSSLGRSSSSRRRGRGQHNSGSSNHPESSLSGAPPLSGSVGAADSVPIEPMPAREEYVSGSTAETSSGRRGSGGSGSGGRPSSATSVRSSGSNRHRSLDRGDIDIGGGHTTGAMESQEERPRRKKSSKSNRLGPLTELHG